MREGLKGFITKWVVVTILLIMAYTAHYNLPTFDQLYPRARERRIDRLARQILAAPPNSLIWLENDQEIAEEVWQRVYWYYAKAADKRRREKEKAQEEAWQIYRATVLKQQNINQ